MSVDAVGTARRGRSVRRNFRQGRNLKMLPALKRDLPLTEPLDEEQIHRIDKSSMNILENIGVHFRDPIAIADWKNAGRRL